MKKHFYLLSGNTSWAEKTEVAYKKKKPEDMDNIQNLIKSRTDSWSLFQEQKRLYQHSITLRSKLLFILFNFYNRGENLHSGTSVKMDYKDLGNMEWEGITAIFFVGWILCIDLGSCLRTS